MSPWPILLSSEDKQSDERGSNTAGTSSLLGSVYLQEEEYERNVQTAFQSSLHHRKRHQRQAFRVAAFHNWAHLPPSDVYIRVAMPLP